MITFRAALSLGIVPRPLRWDWSRRVAIRLDLPALRASVFTPCLSSFGAEAHDKSRPGIWFILRVGLDVCHPGEAAGHPDISEGPSGWRWLG